MLTCQSNDIGPFLFHLTAFSYLPQELTSDGFASIFSRNRTGVFKVKTFAVFNVIRSVCQLETTWGSTSILEILLTI